MAGAMGMQLHSNQTLLNTTHGRIYQAVPTVSWPVTWDAMQAGQQRRWGAEQAEAAQTTKQWTRLRPRLGSGAHSAPCAGKGHLAFASTRSAVLAEQCSEPG